MAGQIYEPVSAICHELGEVVQPHRSLTGDRRQLPVIGMLTLHEHLTTCGPASCRSPCTDCRTSSASLPLVSAVMGGWNWRSVGIPFLMIESACASATSTGHPMATSAPRGAKVTGTTSGRSATVLGYATRMAEHEVGHLDQLRRTLDP